MGLDKNVVAGILSGGGSRRFGSDKAFAIYRGKTLLQWTISNASHITDKIYILAKEEDKYATLGYPVITDNFSVSTPLSGIMSIIPFVDEWLLLLACDIPFFDFKVLDLLWESRSTTEASVIRTGGKYQPFLGLYPKSLLYLWEEAFKKGDFHLQRIVEQMPRIVFEEDDLFSLGLSLSSFSNINTPMDLENISI